MLTEECRVKKLNGIFVVLMALTTASAWGSDSVRSKYRAKNKNVRVFAVGSQQGTALLRAMFGPAKWVACRFDPTGNPISFVKFNIQSRIARTTTGWPQVTQRFDNVDVATGLLPYGNNGITLLAFQDAPIVHIQRGYGRTWYETNTTFNFVSTWGLVPGAPTRNSRTGVCWTDVEQPNVQPSQG